ncbi:Bidirectional sugar transporter SWEET10 [Linum perenne]
MALHLSLVFLFGLLGNAISCLVCLAPLPTFYQIWKKKTSEGYQSIPYIIGLFSAMMWLFYAIFATDAMLLITINVFTFFMQTIYIAIFLFYATKADRLTTIKLICFLNIVGFGAICSVTMAFTHGLLRVKVLGWFCMIFSLCVFVAPLGIVRKVIKTKSVEFMPISLSFFLTLSAVMWFMYGFLKKDPYVAVPNILGLTFGILQMVLYMIYRKSTPEADITKKAVADKVPEVPVVIDVGKLGSASVDQTNQINQVVPVDRAVPQELIIELMNVVAAAEEEERRKTSATSTHMNNTHQPEREIAVPVQAA